MFHFLMQHFLPAKKSEKAEVLRWQVKPFSSGVSLRALKVLSSFQFHSPFPLIWGSPNLGRRRYMAGLLPSCSSSLSAVSASLAPGQGFELEEVLEVEGKNTKTWCF